jgi:hypothetical protein
VSGESGTRRDTPTETERGTAVATRIRTKFTPGEVIEVDERELIDLERQGLIHSREHDAGTPIREGEEAWHNDEPVAIDSGDVTDITPAELADKRKAGK